MRYRRVVAVTVAMLVSVTACSFPNKPPKDPAAFECGLGKPHRIPNPDAPPYTGRGPHPAVAGDNVSQDGKLNSEFNTLSLPASWRAYNSETKRDDLSAAQLVVCLTGLQKLDSKPISSCSWESKRGDMFPATHTFELYETKTGRKLTTFSIQGDLDPKESCPLVMLTGPGLSTDVVQGVKKETLAAQLEPFVMKDLG